MFWIICYLKHNNERIKTWKFLHLNKFPKEKGVKKLRFWEYNNELKTTLKIIHLNRIPMEKRVVRKIPEVKGWNVMELATVFRIMVEHS